MTTASHSNYSQTGTPPHVAVDVRPSTHGEESLLNHQGIEAATASGQIALRHGNAGKEAEVQEVAASDGDMLQVMAQEGLTYQSQITEVGHKIATSIDVGRAQRGIPELAELRDHVKGWLKVISQDVMTSERQQPFMALEEALWQQEEACEKVFMKAVDISGVCDRTMQTMGALTRKVADTFNVSFGQDGANNAQQLIKFDQWEPQIFKPIMDEVNNCVEELGIRCGELLELGSMPEVGSCNSHIRALEKRMYSTDALHELRQDLAKKDELRSLRLAERKKLAEQQGLVETMKAMVKHLEERVGTEKVALEESKTRRKWVRERVQELEKSKTLSRDQALAELLKFQKDAKEQVARLAQQRENAVSHRQSEVESVRAEHERKLQCLQAELIEVAKVAKNHIIFCVDKSYSMSGRRWREALRALEAFRAIRTQHGALDEVSMITFNHRANELFFGQPLNSNFVDKLREDSPSGGTCYEPAWRAVANLSKRGSSGTKLVVVFITDGASSDIPQAASVAESLHNEQSSNGGMSTFVVNVDDEVPKDVLEPVVRAGNGGQDSMKANGEWIYLSSSVSAPEMSTHFEKLASLIDWQEQSMKHRIALLQATEQGEEQRRREHLALLDDDANRRLQSIQVVCDFAKNATAEDAKEVRKMLDEQIAQLRDEGMNLDDAIAKQSAELTRREKSLAKVQQDCKAEEEQAKQDAKTDKETETKMDTLEEHQKSLGRYKGRVSGLLESFGTSDHGVLQQRILDLQKLKDLNTQNVADMKQQLNELTNIHRFFKMVHAHIVNPANVAGLESMSKTRPVFGQLLADRGLLPLGKDPDGPENFEKYLLHACQLLSDNAGHVKKAIRAFTQCGVTPEHLCRSCGQTDKQHEKVKKELWKGMTKKLVESSKDYQALERRVERQEEKYNEKQKKLAALNEKVVDSDDDKHEKEVEKLESEVEKEEEKLEDLRDKLAEMKSKKEETGEIELVKELMERVVNDCHATFKRMVAKYTLQALATDLGTYHEMVHKPLQGFVRSIEATRKQCFALR